ncbi:MAG TPA: hypothetical protein VGG68_14385 [Caulobacteraceae bacterium]
MAKKPRKVGNQAVARRLAGLPPKGPLPAVGTPERKAYRSGLRAVQRAAKRPGAVNPKTGKAYERRAGKRAKEARAQIAKERRLLRNKSVTLLGVTATVTINNDPRYRRRRAFGDISLTRAGYRKFLSGDAAAMEILEEYLGGEGGFDSAPGVQSFEISNIEAAGAQAGGQAEDDDDG